jgi:hypothetical protein
VQRELAAVDDDARDRVAEARVGLLERVDGLVEPAAVRGAGREASAGAGGPGRRSRGVAAEGRAEHVVPAATRRAAEPHRAPSGVPLDVARGRAGAADRHRCPSGVRISVKNASRASFGPRATSGAARDELARLVAGQLAARR